MFPARGTVFHHSNHSLVVLAVLRVEENSFWPHLILFARPNKLGNLQFLIVSPDVVHESVGLVVGIEGTKFSEDTLMGSF